MKETPNKNAFFSLGGGPLKKTKRPRQKRALSPGGGCAHADGLLCRGPGESAQARRARAQSARVPHVEPSTGGAGPSFGVERACGGLKPGKRKIRHFFGGGLAHTQVALRFCVSFGGTSRGVDLHGPQKDQWMILFGKQPRQMM